MFKKDVLKSYTATARVCGPDREVEFKDGVLSIKGITIGDSWQILSMLDTGLFESDDPIVVEEKAEKEAEKKEAAAKEEPKKKRKRRTKAEIEADKQAKLDAQEKAAQEKVGAVEVAEDDGEDEKSSNGHTPSGLDLEQFKSATGLSSVVSDLVEAGIENCDDAIAACLDLQKKGVPCLKGVNVERRVPNIWARVAA